MQTTQPVKRGGRRVDAGRPRGSGLFGEPTIPVRIPARRQIEFDEWLDERCKAEPKVVYQFDDYERKPGK
jgi:hypothetical protein